ncbi:MAG: DUF255 domain-containing protein [Verrucomicrobiales bacterium]|nr:DUF255 domain-containing protein [Verrucomicrobiales bacterium]
MRHLPFQRLPLFALILLALQAIQSVLGAENRLKNELSCYLRQYADDKVNWQPWQSATFAEATARDRIIFASIGYSACQWCRLMREKNFKNPDIIDQLNNQFVCTKIDRLERPDLDLAFRIYAQTTGLPASWPLHVWLTPAGNPMAASSFSSEKSDSGPVRFKTIISNIAERWQTDPDAIRTQSINKLKDIRASMEREPFTDFTQPTRRAVLLDFFSGVSANYDPKHGGFDRSFKFPRPETLEALAQMARGAAQNSYRSKQCLKMLNTTLDSMLSGAIIDPMNGGIFRYTKDNAWRLPQFEKMAVDQARICGAFLAAYQLSGNKRYIQAIEATLEFMQKNLTSTDGTFYTSLASYHAADPHESSPGSYYLWHKDELANILPSKELEAFCTAFGIQSGGNIRFPGSLEQRSRKANIPYASHPDARAPTPGSLLESAIRKVIGNHSRRSPPPLNDMVITGWNGLMISAYAKAGAILGNPSYTSSARVAAEKVIEHLYNSTTNKLARGMVKKEIFGNGFCEDYIYLARGLLDLYRATADIRYFTLACKIHSYADMHFLDPHSGLYHLTPSSKISKSPFGLWVITDGDLPSPNGTAALNLLEISAISGSERNRQNAQNIIRASTPELHLSPSRCGTLIRAIDQDSSPSMQAIISGMPDDPMTRKLAVAVRQNAPGNIALIFMDGQEGQNTIVAERPELSIFRAVEGNPRVFLCVEFKTQNVAKTPEMATHQMRSLFHKD